MFASVKAADITSGYQNVPRTFLAEEKVKIYRERVGDMGQEKKRCTAIVLAAGQGKRMGTSIQKQYIELEGKPVLYYTLNVFQQSKIIEDIVLVVGEGQEEYVRREILEPYHFDKVRAVVVGGKERYDSVWQGLKWIQSAELVSEYIFIHDGARLFVDEDILERGYETVTAHHACVAGMPSKDTVKIVDNDNFTIQTPQRKYVWTIQTPQVFDTQLITEAYSRLTPETMEGLTDDAMVVEKMMRIPVKLFEGAYENIKITTPEDLKIAKVFLKKS